MNKFNITIKISGLYISERNSLFNFFLSKPKKDYGYWIIKTLIFTHYIQNYSKTNSML